MHCWWLDNPELLALVPDAGLDPQHQQTSLHRSDVVLGATIRGVIERVGAKKPSPVALDSQL